MIVPEFQQLPGQKDREAFIGILQTGHPAVDSEKLLIGHRGMDRRTFDTQNGVFLLLDHGAQLSEFSAIDKKHRPLLFPCHLRGVVEESLAKKRFDAHPFAVGDRPGRHFEHLFETSGVVGEALFRTIFHTYGDTAVMTADKRVVPAERVLFKFVPARLARDEKTHQRILPDERIMLEKGVLGSAAATAREGVIVPAGGDVEDLFHTPGTESRRVGNRFPLLFPERRRWHLVDPMRRFPHEKGGRKLFAQTFEKRREPLVGRISHECQLSTALQHRNTRPGLFRQRLDIPADIGVRRRVLHLENECHFHLFLAFDCQKSAVWP